MCVCARVLRVAVIGDELEWEWWERQVFVEHAKQWAGVERERERERRREEREGGREEGRARGMDGWREGEREARESEVMCMALMEASGVHRVKG